MASPRHRNCRCRAQPVLCHSATSVNNRKGSRLGCGSRTINFVLLLWQMKQANAAGSAPGWRERLFKVDWTAPSTACLRELSGHFSTSWRRWCSNATQSLWKSCITL
jgi:hypothetical protein